MQSLRNVLDEAVKTLIKMTLEYTILFNILYEKMGGNHKVLTVCVGV